MSSRIRFFPLTADHFAVLDEQRHALSELCDQIQLRDWRGRRLPALKAAQELLDRKLIPRDLTAYQEAIGVVIGDEIVVREGYRWLTVEYDEVLGPSVCHPQRSIFASPLSAVVKRFARGETVFDLEHFVTETARICRAQAGNPGVGLIKLENGIVDLS